MEATADVPNGSRDPASRFEDLTGMTVEDAARIVLTEAFRQTRGDRPGAFDLAQDTWVRIIDRIVDGRLAQPVDHPRAWLCTMVRHVNTNNYRRQSAGSRRPARPIKPLDEIATSSGPIDPSRRPEDLAVANDVARRLRGAIAELPPEQRAVVHLVMRGHSHPEIAELLDIPVGTSKTRFRSAAKYLRGVPGLALN